MRRSGLSVVDSNKNKSINCNICRNRLHVERCMLCNKNICELCYIDEYHRCFLCFNRSNYNDKSIIIRAPVETNVTKYIKIKKQSWYRKWLCCI